MTSHVEYLRPTSFLDYEHPLVEAFLLEFREIKDRSDLIISLYTAVRDRFLYDPYVFNPFGDPMQYAASTVLETGRSFCIPKAVLLASCYRAFGIPARLGFADVINHMSSPKLIERLRTDLFIFHGYTELFHKDKWVKCTPSFNQELCRKFGVPPLEFDGENDSLFQALSPSGQFMEYVNERGFYTDVPVEEIKIATKETYPHFFDTDPNQDANFEDEISA